VGPFWGLTLRAGVPKGAARCCAPCPGMSLGCAPRLPRRPWPPRRGCIRFPLTLSGQGNCIGQAANARGGGGRQLPVRFQRDAGLGPLYRVEDGLGCVLVGKLAREQMPLLADAVYKRAESGISPTAEVKRPTS
jgi:hypothetical protein